MYSIVQRYTPSSWSSGTTETRVNLSSYSQEYREIEYQVLAALIGSKTISKIYRIQDIYSYGQFLLREQLLAVNSSTVAYYRVRRFFCVHKDDQENALKYNLDMRRCPNTHVNSRMSLTLKSKVTKDYNQVLFVVKVITSEPDKDTIEPYNSLEYYIEYMVE